MPAVHGQKLTGPSFAPVFLTAGYLLTISIQAFLPGADFDYEGLEGCEPNKLMTVPLIILAAAAVLFGIFPAPLETFFSAIAASVI